jgi:uncharacterized surface protein with fasciclin (FAS1) repeats
MIVKMRKKIVYILLISFAIVIPLSAYYIFSNPSFIEYEGVQMKPSMDIADNINYSSQDQEFARMIQAVGFDTFLHDTGPYTVFVPTDSAYAKLDTAFTQTLYDTANEGTLRDLLLYHVVKGKYLAADLKDGLELTTIEGGKLKFTKNGEYWIINGSSFLETYDIKSTNGVIHTINKFLIPPSE